MKKLLYFIMLLTMLLIITACTPGNKIELKYEQSEIEMYVGETINVKPTIIGSVEEGNYTINYELSDTVAEIDEAGNLKALESGIIDVFVTIDIDSNAFAKVTVIINELEKGTYMINLDVNGGDPLENDTIIYKKGDSVELPTPVREGFIFLGWYDGDTLVTSVSNKSYDLVAKWEDLANKVEINYELEKGIYLSNYSTRNELISDLLADFQSIKGDTYTLEYFKTIEDTGYGLFASSKGAKSFFANEEMLAKWGWLLKYAKEVRNASDLDTSQYDNLLSDGFVLTQAATINIELIAFIGQRKINFLIGDIPFVSSDYTNQELANGFWETLHNSYSSQIIVNKGTTIKSVVPNALKVGAIFEGWYTTSNFDSASKVTSSTKIDSNVTLYPKFTDASASTNVIFNYNGGLTEDLFKLYGNKVSSVVLSAYNGGSGFFNGYSNNIYIDQKASDPKAQFSTRIYIAKDEYTNFYKIISILKSGTVSSWPTKAEYVISISGQYSGSYDDNLELSKIKVGNIVTFDKEFSSISSSSVATMNILDGTISNDVITESVVSDFVVPEPTKIGYSFEGWYDDFGNKYESVKDFEGMSKISVYAIWKFKGQIIGAFDDKSWVVSGKTIQLSSTYIGENNVNLVWTSENPELATVNSMGTVTGVSEGLAKIIVSDATYPDVKFEFYVTVFNEEPTGMLKLLVDSNNASIYTRNHILIGITYGSDGAYYADIAGSVSKLLFEDYVVHKDYYLEKPNNTTTLNGLGKNGIDFITVHYAADMPYSSTASLTGGRNLASYNKSLNNQGTTASWHYSTGNDGIWACQSEAWGAWHAGSSKSFSWSDSGVTYQATDPEFAKVTLGSDGYFYVNGRKSSIKNSTSGTKLNIMGLAYKVQNGKYYLGGHYYNDSYRYISSRGGNNNSIGMETSVRQGSDLWLTWQYTAQLCAKLLLKYELPLSQLVGHHFFSGKWCPQPMLEYDMEIWWEFVELVRQEMELYKNFANYTLNFETDSLYLKSNGRISSLPTYSECATYTVTYSDGSTTKTVTLSSLIPGTVA